MSRPELSLPKAVQKMGIGVASALAVGACLPADSLAKWQSSTLPTTALDLAQRFVHMEKQTGSTASRDIRGFRLSLPGDPRFDERPLVTFAFATSDDSNNPKKAICVSINQSKQSIVINRDPTRGWLLHAKLRNQNFGFADFVHKPMDVQGETVRPANQKVQPLIDDMYTLANQAVSSTRQDGFYDYTVKWPRPPKGLAPNKAYSYAGGRCDARY